MTMQEGDGPPPWATAEALSPDDLAELLADSSDGSYFDLNRWPLPAIVDTDCVRSGLGHQMRFGSLPRSVVAAQGGSIRLFMEYETLVETGNRLPKFAGQLGVPVAELRRVLNEDWLPYIEVVKLPLSLRQLDQRALAVRERDADDYPAAALAALLSPCLLLTRNYRHFGPLGVRTTSQGVDGVLAVAEINVGQFHVQAVAMVPAAPVMAVGGATKWASGKIGPVAWFILGGLVAVGIWLYFKQPKERREGIKEVTGKVGTVLLDEFMKATAKVEHGRLMLRACVVPKPERRSPASAILRELALSPESLSAQQIADLLDPSLGLSDANIRAYLRANQETLFHQVRRGGFELGRHYKLRDA